MMSLVMHKMMLQCPDTKVVIINIGLHLLKKTTKDQTETDMENLSKQNMGYEKSILNHEIYPISERYNLGS